MEIVQVLREKLFELEDKDYAEFQRKLAEKKREYDGRNSTGTKGKTV